MEIFMKLISKSYLDKDVYVSVRLTLNPDILNHGNSAVIANSCDASVLSLRCLKWRDKEPWFPVQLWK